MEGSRGSAKLGEYLKRLRKGYGFSLRRVEERAREEGGEIDNSQLSRYEKGRCYPSFDKLRILSAIFNVPIQAFSDVMDLEKYDCFKPESTDFQLLREEGNAEMRRGNFGRAYVIFEKCMEALDPAKEYSDSPSWEELRALCHYNMARALLRLGKVNLSENELRRLLRNSHFLDDHTKMLALILLSNVHKEQGDRFLAIVEAEKCLSMAEERGDQEYAGYSLHALGSAWYEEGDYHRAADFMGRALDAYREIGRTEQVTTLLADIGVCDVALGKPQKGLREIQGSIRSARKEGRRRALAYGLAKKGIAHFLMEDFASAKDFLEQAEIIAGGGDEKYADILFLSAFYLWNLSRKNGNPVSEKIAFGRLKHLRPSLERSFREVQRFDEFIQNGREEWAP
ncbi:MAG: helix-turn-helix transcriptional regulator [Acidobacteriota bacterium]